MTPLADRINFAAMALLHGTCIEVSGAGVLVRGPSGSGKSDLALRLIDRGARLVADDQVEVTAFGDHLIAAAPEALAGMLEVRGLGIVAVETVASQRVDLVVDLMAAEPVERMPKDESVTIEGVALPLLHLAPFQASAAAKVRLAVRVARGGDTIVR